jgi:hypothetical protein
MTPLARNAIIPRPTLTLLAFFAFCIVALGLDGWGAHAQGTGGFTFPDSKPILLDVATIEVDNRYVAPMQPPYIEEQLALSPADGVRLWASARLAAGGTQGVARIIIHEASMTEKPLERTKGIKGWLTKDQSERYEARVRIELVIERNARGLSGSGSAMATRSDTVPEDVTLEGRERTTLALVRNAILDLDAQMTDAIKNNLSSLIIIPAAQ